MSVRLELGKNSMIEAFILLTARKITVVVVWKLHREFGVAGSMKKKQHRRREKARC